VIGPHRFVPEIPAVASSRFDVATSTPGSADRIVRDPHAAGCFAVQAEGLIEGQLAGPQALPDEHALLVQLQSLRARGLGMVMACRAEITDDLARHVHQVVAAVLRPPPVQVWLEFLACDAVPTWPAAP
jgi:hypothetical protein